MASVQIPVSLLQPCPPLPEPAGGSTHQTLRMAIEWASLYHACADGKADLIDAARAATR